MLSPFVDLGCFQADNSSSITHALMLRPGGNQLMWVMAVLLLLCCRVAPCWQFN
jgi:hypothetical protein